MNTHCFCRRGSLCFSLRSLWLTLASLILLPSVAHAATTLRVGYLPVLPMSQLFVMEGEKWPTRAGLKLTLKSFDDAPALMKALNAGDLDLAYIGIGPVLIARAKGSKLHVVASNVVEQVAFVARGDLSRYMLRDAKNGIARFTGRKGRRPRIATFPTGSVPDTILRHWLLKVAQLPLNAVDIVPMGAAELQQALLNGSVDGASVLEPTLSLLLTKDTSAKVVVTGAEMMQNMPGAVVVTTNALLREQPLAVQKMVELHYRATEFLIRHPDVAAAHVQAALGNSMSLGVIEKAISSPYAKFVSDPYRILDSTAAFHAFQVELGQVKSTVNLDNLFETRFYRKLAGG